MRHELVRAADTAGVAAAGAQFVRDVVTAAVAARGACDLAVSGGRTPRAMFDLLATEDLPWESVRLFQVDERVAPPGDQDRNLVHLLESLRGVPARVEPMPVEDDDLEAAAERYALALPATFDLVHLGLGADGHTASLVPGDAVLSVRDRAVAVTAPYQGHRRMTLTYAGLSRAETLLWLVAGDDKRDALRRLLAGDASIPAGAVVAGRSVVIEDQAAA